MIALIHEGKLKKTLSVKAYWRPTKLQAILTHQKPYKTGLKQQEGKLHLCKKCNFQISAPILIEK
jgi:hypothetical protein